MLASVRGGATDASKLLYSLAVQTYWQIVSRSLGRGPVCETLEKAEAELLETQLGDPSVRHWIVECEMSPTDYADLPEFQGW